MMFRCINFCIFCTNIVLNNSEPFLIYNVCNNVQLIGIEFKNFVVHFLKIGSESVDSPDVLTCQQIVFDKDNNERQAWKFCFATNIPRLQVIFFVHVFSAFFVITICPVKLIFFEVSCEDMPLSTSLLARSVGYLLPSPKL